MKYDKQFCISDIEIKYIVDFCLKKVEELTKMEARFIYVTCQSRMQAEEIGAKLVEEKLVACVNIVPGMTSMYWWKGKVEKDQEAIMVAKTMANKVNMLVERIKELHSYEVPCVISLPIVGGNPDYLDWLNTSVS